MFIVIICFIFCLYVLIIVVSTLIVSFTVNLLLMLMCELLLDCCIVRFD